MRRTLALIAGGGPAGAAAAIGLARGGIRPLLLERGRGDADPLCGGFLSWRTAEALERLGVSPEALGAHPIGRVRLFAGARAAEAQLPARGWGLSRRALDGALLERAAEAGAAIERGVPIRAADGSVLRLDDGTLIAGDALFLATGKHELRGLGRPRGAAGDDPALGLRLRLAPSPALRRLVGDAIELHLFRGGYAGIALHEDGSANLCMAVRRSRLAEAGNDPEALLRALADEATRLGDRLAAGHAPAPIDAIAQVPYGWRARTGEAGLFRLGDQAGVIPSLAGEGIGIAVASGGAAAAAYLAGGASGAPAFQHRLAAGLRRPIGVARLLLALAERPRLAAPLVALAGLLPALIDPLARLTRVERAALTGAAAHPISRQ